MGHNICALVVKAPYDRQRAESYDLRVALAYEDLTVLPIDHYWSAYWSKKLGVEGLLELSFPPIFPRDLGITSVLKDIHATKAAVIMTDYFGGAGYQLAALIEGDRARALGSINEALHELGVTKKKRLDEFDTVGLDRFRHNPDYLQRYVELCDELGV